VVAVVSFYRQGRKAFESAPVELSTLSDNPPGHAAGAVPGSTDYAEAGPLHLPGERDRRNGEEVRVPARAAGGSAVGAITRRPTIQEGDAKTGEILYVPRHKGQIVLQRRGCEYVTGRIRPRNRSIKSFSNHNSNLVRRLPFGRITNPRLSSPIDTALR